MAAAQQFLSTPAKLPKQWQPKLNEWSVYHSSHPDVAQAGWRKWSAEHPDWYARRSTSRHPDWYNRQTNTTRRVDYKNINWHYERPSKPTSRVHDDFIPNNNEVMHKAVQRPMPHNKAYMGTFSYPRPFPMEIPPPKWGLYNPPNYEEPARFDHFPPLRYNGY
ncbi:uncharacterized protein LOC143075339 isoform X2 [Mytilus galloprovincialis]|uniref:Uncharacterized protein n=1 Tax=Mytilus galloprovincialis TaxID=29158 RepID=A0A8B6E8Z8_MYTGA|nr:Hypothetical predicted protein [Mytilus galloprovincialis]